MLCHMFEAGILRFFRQPTHPVCSNGFNVWAMAHLEASQESKDLSVHYFTSVIYILTAKKLKFSFQLSTITAQEVSAAGLSWLEHFRVQCYQGFVT